MRSIRLRAHDATTGLVVGYRRSNRLVTEPKQATHYYAFSALEIGMTSAEKRWPEYRWVAVDWGGAEITLERKAKQTFTRAEVMRLLEDEREACAQLCDHIERDPPSRLTGAAAQCAKGIRHGLLPVQARLS